MSISQKLGYISVVEALKNVTKATPSSTSDEKYKVISPETMQETFMSDSEDEGGMLNLIINNFTVYYQWKLQVVKWVFCDGHHTNIMINLFDFIVEKYC